MFSKSVKFADLLMVQIGYSAAICYIDCDLTTESSENALSRRSNAYHLSLLLIGLLRPQQRAGFIRINADVSGKQKVVSKKKKNMVIRTNSVLSA